MKRWLVVGWLLLPSVLCAQETAEAEPESEPIARAIAYPKDVPALAASDQGQIQTPDTPSAAPPVEPPRALPLSPHEAAASPSPAPSTAPAPAELKALPGRTGYAFDQPEILVRQRLFGLAHGVSLLAAACVDLPEQSAAIQKSFVAWHAQQAAAIDQVVHDLAKYYFGPQAAVAQWQDLTRALNLKDYIDQSLGQFELSVACASLTQAITGPRYDLAALLQVEPLIARHPSVAVKRAVYGGDPVTGLRRAAAGARLLVLGRRGRLLPAALRLGSVSRAFAEHAEGVVEIVPDEDFRL